ncbi:MAG: hypothetical protein K6E78_07955 [Treponema sp.]|nr:hypothetical protein [Treponema sp.]
MHRGDFFIRINQGSLLLVSAGKNSVKIGLFFLLFSLLFCLPFYGQADEKLEEENTEGKSELSEVINEIPYPQDFLEEKTHHQLEWYLTFEPFLIFRTIESLTETPYFALTFPFSVGMVFPADKPLSFQPKISFFSEYFLWDGKCAFPARVEDSSNIAFCFLVDLPLNYTYTFREKHIFEGRSGPSFDLRFSKTMNGLNSSDQATSGTVAQEVQEINQWFWKNANFLYWNFSLSYLYNFSRGIKAGPEASFYMPLGAVFSGNGFNAFMVSTGFKVRF